MKKYIQASTNSKLLAVFWYYDGEFVGDEDTLRSDKVISYGDYLQLDSDHFAIWPKYRNMLGMSDSVEYDDVPRGRIMFNAAIHKFVVIGSKAIVDNKNVKDQLLDYYGLPVTTIFRHDEHYG